MKRRRVLATAGGVILSAVAGCIRGNSSIPGRMAVETRHWVVDVLEEGIWYQRQEREESIGRYHELIGEENAAQDKIDDEVEEVVAFVEGTDFTDSYLLVVQNVMQSARWLELKRIQRTDDGLDVEVVTASPDEEYGDDAAAHSLVTRVTDEQAGPPSELQVSVDGKPTAT